MKAEMEIGIFWKMQIAVLVSIKCLFSNDIFCNSSVIRIKFCTHSSEMSAWHTMFQKAVDI